MISHRLLYLLISEIKIVSILYAYIQSTKIFNKMKLSLISVQLARWGRGRSKYFYPLANKMSYYHLKEKSSGHIFKNVTRDRWPVPILRHGILERSTLIVFVTLTPNEALPSDDSL